MQVIHKVITPTVAVRRLMRAHGARSWGVYTNKYDKCRTVKCYTGQIKFFHSFMDDLKALYAELGYGKLEYSMTPTYSDFRDTRAFIVRIPFSLQA